MIEQTELIVTRWHYQPPVKSMAAQEKISNFTSLDVMKKRAGTKKGLPAGSVVVSLPKMKRSWNMWQRILTS